MAAAALLLRADWRRRRAAILGLMLLTGIAGGFVLTAAAGARRTSTSLERLESDTEVGDVAVDVGGLDAATTKEIGDLAIVAESGSFSIVFAIVEGVDEDLALWIPRDAAVGTTMERDRLLRGRRSNPSRSNEIVVNEAAAAVTGTDVGDDITIATMTPEQVAAENYFPARGPKLAMHVVGVTRGAGDLVTNREGAFVATAALWDKVASRVDVFTTYVSVRLTNDASVAEFEKAVHAIVPAGYDLQFLSLAVRTKAPSDAIAALAVGMAVFAIVAAVAGAVAVGQAVGRHLSVADADQQILAALGMSPRSRRLALILSVAPIAIGGALLAIGAALLASPMMPIGLARRAEPHPGFSVDGVVVALGTAGLIAVVLLSATIAAWSLTRRAAPLASRPSAVAAAALRSGAGPVVASGVRLALDRRPPPLPVRSAIAGVTVAVLGTVAVLTFAGSLDRLVSTPERWGYGWDVSLNFSSKNVGSAAAKLVDDERLSDVARWDSGFSYVNGEGTRAYGLAPLRGTVGFSLRSGRQPAADDEVVLGPTTAKRLDVAIGDTVHVAKGADDKAATMRVVGTAFFPEIDEGNFTNAVGYFGRGFAARATVPDLFEASQIVVRFGPGQDAEALLVTLNRQYPDSIADGSIPSAPASVGNLSGVRTLPKWLAAFVVFLGLASLAHILVTTLRRRRRDLATLRSMGFTPRQTVGCIVWQAITIVAAGLIVGVPLGLVAGRAAWSAVADPIGVVTSIRPPWIGLVAVGFGTIAAAALLATVVGLATIRRAPATALRVD